VPTYFRARGAARSAEDRRAFFEAARSSKAKAHVDVITLDTMLNGLRGMRPRHIWLERKSRPAREMAFLSLKELAVFLREHEA
jgi:hypothetical protein